MKAKCKLRVKIGYFSWCQNKSWEQAVLSSWLFSSAMYGDCQFSIKLSSNYLWMVFKFQRPLSGNIVQATANIATYRSHLGLKHRPPEHCPCLYVLKQPLVPGNTLSSCTWQFLVAINHVTNLTLSFPSQSFQGPNSPLFVWVSMLTFRKTTATWLIKPFLYVRTNFIIDFLLKAPKYFKDFFFLFCKSELPTCIF